MICKLIRGKSDRLYLTKGLYVRYNFKVKTPLWHWQNGKSDPEVAPLLLGGGENKRGAAFVTSGGFSISTFGCSYLWGRLSEKELPGECRRCDAQSADGENGVLLWLRRIDRKPFGTHALMLLASNGVSASCSPQGRFSAGVNTLHRQSQHSTKGNMFIMSKLVFYSLNSSLNNVEQLLEVTCKNHSVENSRRSDTIITPHLQATHSLAKF